MKALMLGGATAAALFGAAAAQEAGAPVALSDALVQTAAAPRSPLQTALEPYAVYQQDITTLRDAQLNNAGDMIAAVDTAARHHYPALSRGILAYGAMAASQSSQFVQAVRDAEAYFGREGIILQLTRDPAYSRTLRGADEASQLAMRAANADVSRIARVADRYAGLYRNLSGTRWGRGAIPRLNERTQAIAAMGAAGAMRPASEALAARLFAAPASVSPQANATAIGGEAFWDAVTATGAVTYTASGSASQNWRADTARIGAIDRMVTLAALHALGADRDRPDTFEPMLQDAMLANCMAAAQSAFLACHNSMGRQHEGAFCLAKHALGWAEGDITVNSVALCIGRLSEPAPASAMAIAPSAAATLASAPQP